MCETSGWDMRGQVLLATVSTLAALSLWTFSAHPLSPMAAGLGLLSVAAALRWPSWVLLLFAVFSIFRLHEVLPILQPLHLPQALSVLGLASVGWHILISGRIKPHLSAELKALLVFAVLISLGVPIAKSPHLAYSYWTENFLKLVVFTIALSWVLRGPADFRAAVYMIVLSGALVGAVTILNKLNGVGLVELTRATVARELGSPLGDPNILALTLALSLSFCLCLVLFRERAADAVLGVLGSGLVIAGVICTQSRGGLLGVLAVLAVSFTQVMKSRTLIVFVPLLAAGLYAIMGLSERVSGDAAAMSEESAYGRLYAWTASINMALDRPLTGMGINNFISEFYAYTTVWLDHAITAHSTWFQVLGETGLAGFAVFVAIVVLTFRSAGRAYGSLKRNSAPRAVQGFAFAIVAGLAGFCVAGSFLSQAYDWSFYLLVAFSSAVARWSTTSAGAPDLMNVPERSPILSSEMAAGPIHPGDGRR
jgi:probable O-glycosylation ligase (exosortase A-associated)